MVAPLLLTNGPVRYEAALHGYGTSRFCLFCAIATVFQLYHGSNMMYEMRRRNPEPTLLPAHCIFNLSHHKGMI